MLKSFAIDLTDFDFETVYQSTWERISTHLWELSSQSPYQSLVASLQTMDDLRVAISPQTQDDIAAALVAGECAIIARREYWSKPGAGFSWSTETIKIGSLDPAEALTSDVFDFFGAKIVTLNIV